MEQESTCTVPYGNNPHEVKENNEVLKKPYCNIDFINQFEWFKAVHDSPDCADK